MKLMSLRKAVKLWEKNPDDFRRELSCLPYEDINVLLNDVEHGIIWRKKGMPYFGRMYNTATLMELRTEIKGYMCERNTRTCEHICDLLQRASMLAAIRAQGMSLTFAETCDLMSSLKCAVSSMCDYFVEDYADEG